MFDVGKKQVTLGSGETVTYSGTMYDGKATGIGGYTNKDGDVWRGHWIKDVKHG